MDRQNYSYKITFSFYGAQMQQMWGHWYKHHQMGEKGIVLMVRDGRPRKHEYAESYPLPFYLLLICSSTPHIYAVHPLLTSTHHNSLSTHPPITLPPSTTHYSMSTLPPLHLFILYVRPIPILLSARPSFRPSTLLSHHLSVRSHILPSTLIHSSPTYTFRLFGVLR